SVGPRLPSRYSSPIKYWHDRSRKPATSKFRHRYGHIPRWNDDAGNRHAEHAGPSDVCDVNAQGGYPPDPGDLRRGQQFQWEYFQYSLPAGAIEHPHDFTTRLRIVAHPRWGDHENCRDLPGGRRFSRKYTCVGGGHARPAIPTREQASGGKRG